MALYICSLELNQQLQIQLEVSWGSLTQEIQFMALVCIPAIV